MTFKWEAVHPWMLLAGRVIGAVAVAVSFLVVLMTAALQARVAEELARLPGQLDYSAAYVAFQESRPLDDRIGKLRQDLEKLEDKRAAADMNAESLQDAYLEREAPLRELAAQLEALYGCKIELGRSKPEELAAALFRVRLCADDRALSPPVRAAVAAVLADSGALAQAGSQFDHVDRIAVGYERDARELEMEIAETEKQQSELAKVRGAFSSMSMLEARWTLGGGLLTELPPALVQILLAFVSGMFGALLITLVFVVFPQIHLDLTTSQASFAPRILLGGLISVCVFVVVGGGTAVLGTASALADGETNFLAFCAIGILAGMFSDFVAAWLWERAKTFFGQQAGTNGQQSQQQQPPLPPQQGNLAPLQST